MDTDPPQWAVDRANDIADIIYPRPSPCVVDLIAWNLSLAYCKGEREAIQTDVVNLKAYAHAI